MLTTVRPAISGEERTKFQAPSISVGQSVHKDTSLAAVVGQTKLCHALL